MYNKVAPTDGCVTECLVPNTGRSDRCQAHALVQNGFRVAQLGPISQARQAVVSWSTWNLTVTIHRSAKFQAPPNAVDFL